MSTVQQEDIFHPTPSTGVPYQPAWDGDPGSACIAWTAYTPGGHLLRVRIVNGGRHTEVTAATAHAIGAPRVIMTATGEWRLLCPVFREETWECMQYRITGKGVEELGRVQEITGFHEGLSLAAEMDSPAAGGTYLGNLLLAAVCERAGRSVVEMHRLRGRESERLLASPSDACAYRPNLCTLGGIPAVVYDMWNGESYGIYLQTPAELLRLSEGDEWQMNPACIAVSVEGGFRLFVAWLRITDVMNPHGVIDTRNEIVVKVIDFDRAKGAIDAPALRQRAILHEPVEDLSHGLLDTSPGPRGVWGYLGRRRHPMLARSQNGLYLLWEQKEHHDRRTRENRGVLWCRKIAEGESYGVLSPIGPAVPVASGGLWYELPESRRPTGVACIEGTYTNERKVILRKLGDPASGELLGGRPRETAPRLPRESWSGWSPARLPLPEFQTERESITAGEKTYRLYWFDLHCHTVLSADAEGELDECYRTARHKACLDGALFTDNDHYLIPLTISEWLTNCVYAESFREAGTFLPLLGYEWTSSPIFDGTQIDDHRSVLMPTATEDIVRWNEVEGDSSRLYAFLQSIGGFVHAHHQTWRLTGSPVEANIEAASSWEVYLDKDPSGYHERLNAGQHIGVIGGSDEHRKNPGLGGALTGIYAESLTVKDILRALRMHRCYATTGNRAILDFRINGHVMGEKVTARTLKITLRVSCGRPIEAVTLLCDGVVTAEWNGRGSHSFEECRTESPPTGHHWYYVHVTLAGPKLDPDDFPANLQPATGVHAWSSPIWVECSP